MTTRYLLGIAAVLAGCHGIGRELDLLESSETAFEELLEVEGDSYTYERPHLDLDVDEVTGFEVAEDEVVARWLADREGAVIWREDGEELGDHADGAEIATISELYGQCRDDILPQARASGMLASIDVDSDTHVLTLCTVQPKCGMFADCIFNPTDGFMIEELTFPE